MTVYSTSTVPLFLNAFQESLADRSGLAGVQVVSGPLSLSDAALESIQFDGVTMTQVPGGLGNSSRDEEYTLTGLLYIAKPGAGETAIRAARDRCFAIFAEMETALREDHRVADNVRSAQIAGVEFDQGVDGNGARVSRLTWRVIVQSRLKVA